MRIRLPNRSSAGLAVSLQKAATQDSLYVSQVTLLQAPPSSLDPIQSIPGVVCAHTVLGRPTVVVVYWRTCEQFARGEAEMHRLLGLADAVPPFRMHGFVAGLVSAPRPISFLAAVTVILSLIGAFEATRLLVNHMIAKPGVLIAPGRAGAINYFPDQQLYESLKITNRIPIEQDVTIDDVVMQRIDANPSVLYKAQYDPPGIRDLREDQSEAIQIGLRLPSEPGTYAIVATMRSKAGWLRGSSPPQAYSMVVNIWSPVPRTQFKSWSQNKTGVVATFQLDVGYAAPYGLDCTAALVGGAPEVTIIPPPGSHDVSEPRSSGTGRDSLVAEKWITRPFPDFATTSVPVTFQSPRELNWSAFPVGSATLNCSQHAAK